MAFQQNTFTMPVHLYTFLHILFLSMIKLQMKWLMVKGLTQCWTLLLHSCRTSVVWLAGWLADRRDCGKNLIWLTLGKGRKELVMSPVLTWKAHKRNKGRRENKRPNVREIEILLYALCWSIYACMPFGLSSVLVSFVVFRCVTSQFPSALYLCAQAHIWRCVRWLGHDSWPESF